jgi:hypothetical protein
MRGLSILCNGDANACTTLLAIKKGLFIVCLMLLLSMLTMADATQAFSENCKFLLDGCDVDVKSQPVPASRTPESVPDTGDKYWLHNRSRMVLHASGAARKFIYQVPREGLAEVGVKNGSILFEGERRGDRYIGTAYIFSSNCGKLSYEVSGPVSDDDRKVTLYGRRPRVNSNCQTVERADDVLVFTYQGRD